MYDVSECKGRFFLTVFASCLSPLENKKRINHDRCSRRNIVWSIFQRGLYSLDKSIGKTDCKKNIYFFEINFFILIKK
jgi:hypothetical protein